MARVMVQYKMIEDSEDQPLELSIFNTKNRETRKVVCQPNRRWGGAGLLGMTIKFDTFEDAEEAVFHVLEVEPNSPAANAGLPAFRRLHSRHTQTHPHVSSFL